VFLLECSCERLVLGSSSAIFLRLDSRLSTSGPGYMGTRARAESWGELDSAGWLGPAPTGNVSPRSRANSMNSQSMANTGGYRTAPPACDAVMNPSPFFSRAYSDPVSPTGRNGQQIGQQRDPFGGAAALPAPGVLAIPEGGRDRTWTEHSYFSAGVSRSSNMNRTRGSCASSSPPPSSGHGTSTRQRRFNSRHVPDSAEELVHSEVLTPEMVSRFNGLMRHLKNNSEWDEQQKQVMVSNVEALVPEEFEDLLQSEFMRRCSFGDRMNTELMSSFKWVKTLKDCSAVLSFDAEKKGGSADGVASITLASADVIFLKVLHDCDYGGKRLTYDLFCKALYLVSRALRPDLGGEAAFSELLTRISSAAPEDPTRLDPAPDLMLDANVLLVLDHFKPALYDVFHTFCNRQLANPAHASPGSGSVRLSERTFWKHTQDSQNLSSMGTNLSSFGRSRMDSTNGGRANSSAKAGLAQLNEEPASNDGDNVAPVAAVCDSTQAAAAAGAVPSGGGGSVEAAEKLDSQDSEAAETVECEADAGGGYAEISTRPVMQGDMVEPIFEDRITPSSGGPLMQQSSGFGGSLLPGNTFMSASNTMYSGTSQDPYQYANGQPVIKNRKRHMSVNQMLLLCKELKIMPDLLSRLEIVKIFKRAQCAGSHTSHGSSLYGYLTAEAFMDAAGQLALEAYAKSPYSEEYPAPHEKIQAFWVSILQKDCRTSREVHERFLYGCSGRGR